MKTIFSFRRVLAYSVVVAVLFVDVGGAVRALGVSDAHLDSARKAINAMRATDQFDSFLPTAAHELKNELIGDDPNLAAAISDIVDEQALALARRRSDLEKEIAHVYAKYFTREELETITAFYSSSTGKKFLKEVPSIARDAYSTFEAWRSVIMQDLAKNVKKEMSEMIKLDNSATPTVSSSPIKKK
ncbi:DUF2059 domain-containing protein [Bartonella sp. CB178]|uniref:DUF2059 domain-containing protein n=1 Tax=Bartonella sp. CB178 TaxID=3112255 RepID=UPI00300DBFAB